MSIEDDSDKDNTTTALLHSPLARASQSLFRMWHSGYITREEFQNLIGIVHQNAVFVQSFADMVNGLKAMGAKLLPERVRKVAEEHMATVDRMTGYRDQ